MRGPLKSALASYHQRQSWRRSRTLELGYGEFLRSWGETGRVEPIGFETNVRNGPVHVIRGAAFGVIATMAVQVAGAGVGWAQEDAAQPDDFACAVAYAVLGMGRPDVRETTMHLAAEALGRVYGADPSLDPEVLSQDVEADVTARFERIMEGEEDVQVVVQDVHACNALYGIEHW